MAMSTTSWPVPRRTVTLMIDQIPQLAPALSNDGKTLYVVVKG